MVLSTSTVALSRQSLGMLVEHRLSSRCRPRRSTVWARPPEPRLTVSSPVRVRKQQMKADFINPLIQATIDTFTMMMSVTPVRANVQVKHGTIETYGLAGIVRIEGSVEGAIVLNMPELTALKAACAFTGDDLTAVNSEVVDSIGELTSLVAGDAKTRLHKIGYELAPLPPRVVLGSNLVSAGPSRAPWVSVTFQSRVGSFDLEASLAEQEAPRPAASEA